MGRLQSSSATAVTLVLTVAFAWLLLVAPAHGAFPGRNGKIAFTRYTSGDFEIWDMNPDGSGRTRLTNVPGTDTWANWSPDGTKIAFTSNRTGNNEIWVMNADGSNQVPLTVNPANDNLPAWSPDGTKIAFTSDRDVIGGQHSAQIFVMNSDGSGQTRLTSNPPLDPDDPSFTGGPRWSPDGQKIAFTTNKDLNYEVYVMNSDGTGQTRLTNLATDDESPDWSPDGSKLAFVSDRESGHQVWVMNADGSGQTRVSSDPNAVLDPAWSPDGTKFAVTNIDTCCSGTGIVSQIYTMNADGTNSTNLTNEMTQEERPAWQPLPVGPGFARPKGATPFQTYLTVAYKQCVSPTEQHGAPLAVLSCNPPQQASNFLTVGTLDANGQQAKAVGVYRLDVKSSPADVKITFALKDVRNKLDLTDYTGELRVTENWRLTDKNNGPISGGGGTDSGTNSDIPFPPLDVACAATTSDATVGSTCDATSSANAIVPGSIQAGTRMNSELGQVQVQDGGSDGVAATTADNTLFMDQGIFAP